MNLLEKDIEDIIYSSPWMLDERYIIPKIKGSRNEFGRQINIGRECLNRYIDLLFKDTRDERPVIVELKKNKLKRADIGQILEYKALLVSMEESNKNEWQSEFGKNYYYPKLILIGTEASEEVKITANLSGVEIRTLVGVEELEVNFKSIYDINEKLSNWNKFLNTGNRTLEDRDNWIIEIHEWIKNIISEYHSEEITTINNIYRTKKSHGWITETVYPFINIPIYYKQDKIELGGIYEYFDENMPFSDEHIYFDFVIRSIFDEEYEDENKLEKLKNETKNLFLDFEYELLDFEDGIAVVKIQRNLLNDYDALRKSLTKLIDDAIYINNELDKFI
ncbi:MAG: hypothetical protein ACRC76_01820 [Proteocatella sp.]